MSERVRVVLKNENVASDDEVPALHQLAEAMQAAIEERGNG
jgi:hypothetical protein